MVEKTNPTFEAALDQLQQVVKKLESGELTLEQSLQAFEDGVRLTKSCQEQLSGAEKRIELLTRTTADGQTETEPFNPGRAKT